MHDVLLKSGSATQTVLFVTRFGEALTSPTHHPVLGPAGSHQGVFDVDFRAARRRRIA